MAIMLNKQIDDRSPVKSNKIINFNVKARPLQVFCLVIECFVALICVFIIISGYMISIPDIELIGGTLPKNPRDIISLQQLPNMKFNMDIIGSVNNNNLIPVPGSIYVKGSIDSDNPDDRVIFGSIKNIVLMPLKKITIQSTVTGNINLFEPGSRTLKLIFDACDIFSTEGGRSTLKSNIYADVYLGYGMFSVYMKTINTVVELPCPLINQSISEVILGAANNLLF